MPNSSEADILTTFQAARLCGVSHKSVERWIDAGLLRGFRTPGGHRRVYRPDLLEFMQRRQIAPKSSRAGAKTIGNPQARILIVDDDEAVRLLLAEFFRARAGKIYQLQLAESGYEAGVQVERFNPHVVLLDLMMDDLDGFEVCQKIRSDPAHAAITVFAMTGSPSAAQRARESGSFHRVFVKPLDLEQMKEAIDQGLADRNIFPNPEP